MQVLAMAPPLSILLVISALLLGKVTIQADIMSENIGENASKEAHAVLPKLIIVRTGPFEEHLVPLSRQVAAYNITATLKEKPTSQPAKMVLVVMSFVVKYENVTQNVSDTIIECLATETSTNSSNWGLFAAAQFAAGMIQVEYYAFVHMDKAIAFRAQVTAYGVNKTLSDCVRSKVPSFSANADIVPGRRVTEALPNEVKEVVGGIPAWVIGAIVGGMVLVTMVSIILATVKKTRIFNPIVFEEDYAYQPTPEEEEARAAADLENDLRAIASGWH